MSYQNKEADNDGGALTPRERERDREREQLMLESMPFPDAPATEAERCAARRVLPQRTRVAIRRLHRAFGNLPGAVMKERVSSKLPLSNLEEEIYSSRQYLKGLTDRWTSWAEHPPNTITDRSTHSKGDFAQYLAQH